MIGAHRRVALHDGSTRLRRGHLRRARAGAGFPGAETIDLNPFGRAQTNKYRPVIPVLPQLAAWLTAEFVTYERLARDERKGAGFLVNYYGWSVLDVDTSWRTMLRELKLPSGREWKAYLLRNRGVAKWDLEGWLGHDSGGSIEVYAIGRFATVFRALEDVLGEIEQRVRGALRRTCAEVAPLIPKERRAKMSG